MERGIRKILAHDPNKIVLINDEDFERKLVVRDVEIGDDSLAEIGSNATKFTLVEKAVVKIELLRYMMFNVTDNPNTSGVFTSPVILMDFKNTDFALERETGGYGNFLSNARGRVVLPVVGGLTTPALYASSGNGNIYHDFANPILLWESRSNHGVDFFRNIDISFTKNDGTTLAYSQFYLWLRLTCVQK
jgi:hypothetical protein